MIEPIPLAVSNEKPKKKIDPRIWMGICSGVGYLIILGIKVYAFGWEGVPRFWVYAGLGVVAVMIGVAVFHRDRSRRTLKAAIERSSQRPARRAPSSHKED